MKINEGLLYGYGIFETIKVVDKKPIYLVEHFNRMINSAKVLGINIDIDFKNFKDKIINEINKYSKENFVLRVSILKNKKTSDIIFNKRDIVYNERMYEEGFKLTFSEILKNETSLITYHKTLNYLENLIELNNIKNRGYNEIIFLNTKGYVAECATSNIFIIKNEKIYTSKKESGLLNGIIREKIINYLKNTGKEIYEESIDKKFLLNADEVFITNSVMGIMPVSKINDLKYEMKFTKKLKKNINI